MDSFIFTHGFRPFPTLHAGSDIQHPVQRAMLLQPNDVDLRGFWKPTSIFFEHFLCCACRQYARRCGGKNVQIKACYPLLGGRLHIMMKGLALSICERIAHCCGGRSFFLSSLIVSMYQI